MTSAKTLTWPNDARVAFVLGIAFEAWDKNKPTQGAALQSPLPKDALWKRDWSTETFREFGAKVGLKRLLDICDRYEVKTSVQVNGLTCVYYPELVKDCYDRGHELVAHGWDQGERLYMLTREQERENILKTIDAIVKVTGERPKGWSSPGVRPTDNTVELLAETGLEFHCDFHDDEMPYPIWVGDKLIIEFPHQYTINDHRMQEEGHAPGVLREVHRRVRLPLPDRRRKSDHDERHHPRLSDLADSLHRYFRENHRLREESQGRLVRSARRCRGVGEEACVGE